MWCSCDENVARASAAAERLWSFATLPHLPLPSPPHLIPLVNISPYLKKKSLYFPRLWLFECYLMLLIASPSFLAPGLRKLLMIRSRLESSFLPHLQNDSEGIDASPVRLTIAKLIKIYIMPMRYCWVEKFQTYEIINMVLPKRKPLLGDGCLVAFWLQMVNAIQR